MVISRCLFPIGPAINSADRALRITSMLFRFASFLLLSFIFLLICLSGKIQIRKKKIEIE